MIWKWSQSLQLLLVLLLLLLLLLLLHQHVSTHLHGYPYGVPFRKHVIKYRCVYVFDTTLHVSVHNGSKGAAVIIII